VLRSTVIFKIEIKSAAVKYCCPDPYYIRNLGLLPTGEDVRFHRREPPMMARYQPKSGSIDQSNEMELV
jgi:hypothetical protein